MEARHKRHSRDDQNRSCFSPRSARTVSCSENLTMVVTIKGAVLMWGRGFYGTEVQASLPAHLETDDDPVISIAACRIQSEKEKIELTFALTAKHSMVLFRVGRSSVDFAAVKIPVPCKVEDLTTIHSTGSVLLATNEKGQLLYADCRSWCAQVQQSKDEDASSNERSGDLSIASLCKREVPDAPMPMLEWRECELIQPDKIAEVHATADTFFIRTKAGDVYSWNPLSGKNLTRHAELDDRIVLEIACGMQHAVARTDAGEVLTCGSGSSGQLGHGTFEDLSRFQSVQAEGFSGAEMICCGPMSTAVAQNGKVQLSCCFISPKSDPGLFLFV